MHGFPRFTSLLSLPLLVLLAAAPTLGCSKAHANGHDSADGGGDPNDPLADPHDTPHARPHASSQTRTRGHDAVARAPAAAAHVAHAAPAQGHAHASDPAPAHGAATGHDEGERRRAKFVVPFTWDSSDEEPLARMRGFMRSAIADNARYSSEKKPEFFHTFANGQKPRATLVTCSDSRVQSTAFDASPENDIFTIRNIGNQMLTAEGSVEYGVHHLKTPLLFIMGHSGCGAVKAAMGDFSKESASIVRELTSLQIPKPAAGATPEQALSAGVIANVNAQVSLAVLKFGEEVERGDLTVVGAVYDFKNELEQGFGRFKIVNVNGHSDAEKVDAFTRAMMPLGKEAPRPPTSSSRKEGSRARGAAH